jgi:transposase
MTLPGQNGTASVDGATAGATPMPPAAPRAYGYEVVVDQRRPRAGDNPLTPCVLSVDPGVKVLGTCLRVNDARVFETNAQEAGHRIRMALRTTDQLVGLKNNTARGSGRARFLRDKAKRVNLDLKKFTNQAHHAYADFLVKQGRPTYVLLPKLAVSSMVRRYDDETERHRVLNPMTTRTMLAWRHHAFRSRVLASKARFYPSCVVLLCTERYTTKACNRCFLLTEKIGGKSVFTCSTPDGTPWLQTVGLTTCGNVKDRDANGSCGVFCRNIALALDATLTDDGLAVYLNPDDAVAAKAASDAAKSAQKRKNKKKGGETS